VTHLSPSKRVEPRQDSVLCASGLRSQYDAIRSIHLLNGAYIRGNRIHECMARSEKRQKRGSGKVKSVFNGSQRSYHASSKPIWMKKYKPLKRLMELVTGDSAKGILKISATCRGRLT